MAYTRLTLAAFKTLYGFPTLTDDPYEAWAGKAERLVTDRYGASQQDATELLTAHYLTLNGIGASATGGLASSGVSSFKSGDFSASIAGEAIAAGLRSGYGATVYGRQFAQIQARLFGGPRLVLGASYTGVI